LIERSPTHPIRFLAGKLGVVEEGALADLLLVDGDPLIDIKLLIVANANQNLS
jgi:imidazolonepropionase-like amidohydrolase